MRIDAVFCGYQYAGGPTHIRTHLDKNIRPMHMRPCDTKVNWFQRHSEVVEVFSILTQFLSHEELWLGHSEPSGIAPFVQITTNPQKTPDHSGKVA